MPSSRDLASLLPAILKISEEAQSKIEGGILKLLPIFLLLVFFYSFVPRFLSTFVSIWQFSKLSGYLNQNREIQHLPSTVLPGPGGRGLPPGTFTAQDRCPSCPTPDSGGRGYLGNHKSSPYELNNFSLRRRVPSGGLKKGLKVQEWKSWVWNCRIFDKSV